MIHEEALFQIGVRWLHFVFGIIWIGLLYFFNFVNVPFQKELAADVKPKVNPKLLGRALWWFRHAAWLTVVMGVVIFWVYWDLGTYTAETARPIMMGGALGLIMAVNVWTFIWPNQKKALHAMATGGKAEPQWGMTALAVSRANVVLSFPMLFFMAAQSHYGAAMTWANAGMFLVIFAVLGWLVIWWVQMRPAPAPSAGATGGSQPMK